MLEDDIKTTKIITNDKLAKKKTDISKILYQKEQNSVSAFGRKEKVLRTNFGATV